MTSLPLVPPRVPICRSAEDPTQPCRYAGVCHESRQRLQAYNDPPQRGAVCWAFEAPNTRAALAAARAGEADDERAAIVSEGTP